MKKLVMMGMAFCAVLSSLSQEIEKKPLGHDVYASWQTVSSLQVTDNGNCLFYNINLGHGDGCLVIHSVPDGRELSVPRGQNLSVTPNGSYAIFTIKSTFEQIRKAKIAKKKEMPKDTLAYIDLASMEVVKIPAINSYKSVVTGNFVFAYETGKKDSSLLIVVSPGSVQDTIRGAKSYDFDYSGQRLVVSSKDSMSIYYLPTMERKTLIFGKKYYSKPFFNSTGNKMAFLASADSSSTGNKHCSLYLYEETVSGKGKNRLVSKDVREILSQDYVTADGLCLTENGNPFFSSQSDRLFFGVSKFIPCDDTTLYSFETASLDIWNYDQFMTPPFQKASLDRRKKETRLSVIDLSDLQVTQLALSDTENIGLVDGGEGEYALSTDNGPYLIDASWDSNDKSDVSLVNLRDGLRKRVFTGIDARVSISPKGKYLYWYSGADSSWFSYRISDGKTVNLTSGVDGIFYDDEADYPNFKPSVGYPHWGANDEWFLLEEKFDLFKFHPDGKYAINLTAGVGKRDSIRYRYLSLERDTVPPMLSKVGVRTVVPSKETIYLSSFSVKNKEAGFATINVSKPGLISSFTAPKSYTNPVKALDAPVIAYKKGDFRNSPDVYVTSDCWKTEQKLTAINPQQKDYLWGNISLVHWKAYDGTPLDGLLILPENLDTTSSYPMIVYFYERYSDELYLYRKPAPSASTINWSVFASNGYVVFIPDIKYVDGHPGECAYNCVCSGCDVMCERYPFINHERIGIQGQSWGGYQTAYLVTRTDMFAAAGAGAPVGNMTSAYGGIRWSTGIVRAVQYEHGQSRIGKSMWEEGGLDLYIENSPVFHTQNVKTPVLIMHNDADGAVPWYQGIEFFMSLRRFHHPAWMLQYNGEEHNLRNWYNKVDLSKRLQQFFDHYLKDAPMPPWMKDGVPMVRKGQEFGF